MLAGLTAVGARPALADFTGDGTCEVHTTTNAYSDNALRFYCLVATTNNTVVRMRFGTDEDLVGATTTIYGPTNTTHDFDLWGLSENTTYYYEFEDINENTLAGEPFTVGQVPEEIIDRVEPLDDGMSWDTGRQDGDSQLEYVAYDHEVCDSSGAEDYILVLQNDWADGDLPVGDGRTVEVVWYEKNFGAGYAPTSIQAFDVAYDDAGNPRFHVITGDRAAVKTVQMNGKVQTKISVGSLCSSDTSTDGPCFHHAVFPSTLDGERRWFIARARAKRAQSSFGFRRGTAFPGWIGCGTGDSYDADCATTGEESYFAIDGIEARASDENEAWALEEVWELDQDPDFYPDECPGAGGNLGLRNEEVQLECGAFWGGLMEDAAGDQVYDYSHVNSIWHDGGKYVYVTSPTYSAIAKYEVYDYDTGLGEHVLHDPPELVSVLNAYDNSDTASDYGFYGTTDSEFPYDLGHHLVGLDGETGTRFTIFDNYGNKCFSRGIEFEIGDWDTGEAGDEWKVTDVWEMDLSGYLDTTCDYDAGTGEVDTGFEALGQNCMTHGSVYEVDPGENVVLSCGLVDETHRVAQAQGAIMEFDRDDGDVDFSISPVCDNDVLHNPYRAVPLHSVVGGSPRF